MRFFKITFLLILTFTVSACSVTFPRMNDPLKTPPKPVKAIDKRSEELTVILTFSGGGTRAAALSYGVLDELRRTPVVINHQQRRLLDEVDLISSVSGGSFTSAYYGLFGDRIFQDFERKFLKRRVQSDLIKLSLLSPKAWIRLLPGFFERSDLAAEYYNRLIFRKKTFGDLRKDAPYIVINATDLSIGHGFAFTDYHFSWICSDLNTYPIARAVAASSAVPVLFSPITLKNHAKGCTYSPIIWAAKSKDTLKQKRYEQSLKIRKYRDGDKVKYLHLVDGGVADNLGVRSILDIVTYHRDDMWNVLKTYHMTNTKKLVFIVVNASGFSDPKIARNRISPSTLKVIDTVTSIQFDNFNIETLDLLRSKFPQWKKQIQAGRCAAHKTPGCNKVDIELIEVNLQDVTPAERKSLLNVPTSLELPPRTVDLLKRTGANLLKRSPAYQRLLWSLKKPL